MKYPLWLGAAAVLVFACGSEVEQTTGPSPQSSATTSAASGGATGGGGSAGASGGTGGSQDCNPACTMGLECCNGLCVNQGNDINNCGSCGNPCAGSFPFCNGGTCGPAPCDPNTVCDGNSNCCGSNCCVIGEICCVVPLGPVGPPTCTPPNENGTCDPGCPKCACASPDTPVATPFGERAIAELAVGDLVYSVDESAITVVPIIRVQRVAVPEDHRIVALTLESGRVVEMSARHPTADGRLFGALKRGDRLGEARIVDVRERPYGHHHTHDILPDSDSGAYFAAGALVGSTLQR